LSNAREAKDKMLKQTSVKDIRSQFISPSDGYVAITMIRYPRALRRELRDAYIKILAPDLKLFLDFRKHLEKTRSHELAFEGSKYERRFTLSSEALAKLKELSELSQKQDVYLVCQCAVGEHCHRELLLLTAKKMFNATIGPVHQNYPTYNQRLRTMYPDHKRRPTRQRKPEVEL
jgi:uncharacterized protein YeaO (DUF488 family)